MPDMIALSESAVAVLRFRVKGYRMPATDGRIDSFRELAAAGIMEPDGGDFRFTEDGWARREEILREAEDRIERERLDPPDAGPLSEAARGLLRRVASGDRVPVDGATRPLYRELAAARIMSPVSGFIGGPESGFRFTYWGWRRRDEWIAPPAGSP
jgi:hypothetical protein